MTSAIAYPLLTAGPSCRTARSIRRIRGDVKRNSEPRRSGLGRLRNLRRLLRLLHLGRCLLESVELGLQLLIGLRALLDVGDQLLPLGVGLIPGDLERVERALDTLET